MNRRALLGDPLYLGALGAALPAVAVLAAATSLRLTWSWPAPWPFMLMVVAAPVLEEIVFRAGLQDALSTRSGGRIGVFTYANLGTGVVFCLLHLWRHPFFWALATFFPAVVFGLVYERHRRLAAPILLHAFYNAVYLICLPP